jgi:fructose-bisphosphate aldolase class II
VFHGSSGSSAQENAEAVTYGVVKVNVDTDNQYAFTRAFTGHGSTTGGGAHGRPWMGNEHGFDPWAWGAAEAAMAERVGKPASNSDPPDAASPPRRRPVIGPLRR